VSSLHPDCNHAGQRVRCERCGREYVCGPTDDYYCTPEGDHCCEPCLLTGAGIPADRVYTFQLPGDAS
jgi:hypothetical protein